MPTTCQINFENNAQKIVYSGQKLHITVRLKLTEEINVRSLHIHLCGTAHVEFFQDDKKRNGYYTADENVLDIRKCLSGGNGKIQVLPLGTHDYSCTCNLPRNIPSSFSGAYGHIKYTANVVLGIPLRPDETFEEKFHVFKSVNLNDYPSLQAEVLDHHTRKLLACEEFQISISTRLPARGYACGQSINLEIRLKNRSRFHIDRVIVYMLRHTVYLRSAHSKHKKTEDVIVTRNMFDWKCKYMTTEVFHGSIQVPTMIPPTDTETNKIIKIGYSLSIRAFFLRKEVAIYGDFAIKIGTTPFGDGVSPILARTRAIRNTSENVESTVVSPALLMGPSTSMFPDDDTVSIRTYTSTPPPFPDDEFDLPTYDEAMLLDQEIDVNLESIEDSFAQLYIRSTVGSENSL